MSGLSAVTVIKEGTVGDPSKSKSNIHTGAEWIRPAFGVLLRCLGALPSFTNLMDVSIGI